MHNNSSPTRVVATEGNFEEINYGHFSPVDEGGR